MMSAELMSDPKVWLGVALVLFIIEVTVLPAAIIGGLAVGAGLTALALWLAPGAVAALGFGWADPLVVWAIGSAIGVFVARLVFSRKTRSRVVDEDINAAPYKGDND